MIDLYCYIEVVDGIELSCYIVIGPKSSLWTPEEFGIERIFKTFTVILIVFL